MLDELKSKYIAQNQAASLIDSKEIFVTSQLD